MQAAFVLHRRDYRDTSQIIELFTVEAGRVSVVAKGAKRAKSPLRTSLQMFQPLLVTWLGKHELMTLTQVELQQPFASIPGKHLAWGFYLNELLYRLLPKQEAYPDIFHHYQTLLQKISLQQVIEADLRCFEYEVLQRMGYGLHLNSDLQGAPISAESFYYFEPMHSPVKTEFSEGKYIYAGESLLALANNNLTTAPFLKDAKRLLRQAIQELVGEKPFKSRELLL